MTHSIILIIGVVFFSILLIHAVLSLIRLVKSGKAYGIEHSITLSNVLYKTALAVAIFFACAMLDVFNNNILLILVIVYSTLAGISESTKESMYRIESLGIQTVSKLLPFDELTLVSYRKKWFSPLLLVQVQESSNNKVHRFSVSQKDFDAMHNCFKTMPSQ